MKTDGLLVRSVWWRRAETDLAAAAAVNIRRVRYTVTRLAHGISLAS